MTRGHKDHRIEEITVSNSEKLCCFYRNLPSGIKSNFQPHPLKPSQFLDYMRTHYRYAGYLLSSDSETIGYIATYHGHFDHDLERIKRYPLEMDFQKDAQIAPVVHPSYHGTGLAEKLFDEVKKRLIEQEVNRLFLWGGVKSSNLRALGFYQKIGFQEQGRFEHEGENIDMSLSIS